MLKNVAIVGPGLLGGSLALALKARTSASISIWARREAAVEEVRGYGCADRVSTSLEEVVAEADAVVLAVPIGAMPELARTIAPLLRPETLVTDVGSVKGLVCAALDPIFSGRAHFVGSHPMAGSEQTGMAAARADLFEGANCIITPTEHTTKLAFTKARDLWQAVGGLVSELDPVSHDTSVAAVSHLPHLLAAVLVNTVANSDPRAFDFCGPGFRDTTRVAGGLPSMWTEILGENSRAVKQVLDALIEKLSAASTLLASQSPERDRLMNELLTQAKAQRDRLRLPKILSDV